MVHSVPLTKLLVIKLGTKNGEVITLKHETILKINLLENIISENNILCVIRCIVKLQGHKGVIKTQMLHCRLSNPLFALFIPGI